VDGSTPAVSYSYEDGASGNTNRRVSVTYPDGREVKRTYGVPGSDDDRLSRVEGVFVSGEGDMAATYSYLGLSWFVKVVYDEAGVQLSYLKTAGQPVGDAGDPYNGYDRFGRTVDMRWVTTSSGAVRDRFQWGYDPSSNRTWRENLAAASGQDEFYRYDGLYQLTEFARGNLNINRTAISAIPANEQTFSFDPSGNWESFTDADDGAIDLDQDRIHNQDNQITQIDSSNFGLAYDKNGNATQQLPNQDGDWNKYFQLKWDAWNRLVELKDDGDAVVAAYQYDGATRRTTKTVGSDTHHYFYNDQWRPVEERVNAATTAERQYVWGVRYRDDLVFRERDTTGDGSLDERLYVTHDYYNPTAIINTSGFVEERYAYSAFGVRRIMGPDFSDRASSNFDWDFGFHGQFLDEESGYYNYAYRYYSPELGRFINRDPIEERGGINLYAFVGNSPVNRYDRFGLLIQRYEMDPAQLPVTAVPPSDLPESHDHGTVTSGATRARWNFNVGADINADVVVLKVDGNLSLELSYNQRERRSGNPGFLGHDNPNAYPLGELSTIGHERYHALIYKRNFNAMADALNPWDEKKVRKCCAGGYIKWIRGMAAEFEGQAALENGQFDAEEYGGGAASLRRGEALMQEGERLRAEALSELEKMHCPPPIIY